MNKFSLLVCFLFPLFVGAQNLVPNPSFEIYSSCPDEINQNTPDEVAKATGWQSTLGTPDYFNACAPLSSNVSVPNNQFGSQNAATGNAYCGIIVYGGGGGYREIISTKLLSTLSIGIEYYVSLKVSLAGRPIAYWGRAIDKIGIKFSTVQYGILSPPPIDNAAQVYSHSIITDTTNWVLIKGSFIADSSYKYINIGNFFDDAHTDTIHVSPSGNNYYYVDDVCVSTDSIACFSFESVLNILPLGFATYPNPANDFIIVEFGAGTNDDVVIINVLGQIVDNFRYIGNNNMLIDCSQWANGIYFLRIKGYNNKIIVNHTLF